MDSKSAYTIAGSIFFLGLCILGAAILGSSNNPGVLVEDMNSDDISELIVWNDHLLKVKLGCMKNDCYHTAQTTTWEWNKIVFSNDT